MLDLAVLVIAAFEASYLIGVAFVLFTVYVVMITVRGEPRVCPECAETVRNDAKVCKHCGHRLQNSG